MAENTYYFFRARTLNELFLAAALVLVALTATDSVHSQESPEFSHFSPYIVLERTTLEPRLAVDINGDGRTDAIGQRAYVEPGEDGDNFLVIWSSTPDGRMVENTADLVVGTIPSTAGTWRQVISEDFNGDGRPDLLLVTHGPEPDCGDGSVDCWPGGKNRLVLSREDGKLEDLSETHLPNFSDFSHGVSTADFDGDGDVDIWVNNLAGSALYNPGFPYLLHNDGQGRFTVAADAAEWPGGGNTPIVGLNGILPETLSSYGSWSIALDADGDGDIDLGLTRLQVGHYMEENTIFENRILMNDGTGKFDVLPGDSYISAGCSVSPYAPDPEACRNDNLPQTQAVLIYDFNNDGLDDFLISDLVFSHPELGSVGVLQFQISNGDGTFRDETSSRFPTVQLENYTWPQLFDIDGDGHRDLFVSLFENSGGGWEEARLNDGEGYFRKLPDGWIPAGWNKIVLDVDGDGGTDIIEENWDGVVLHKMVHPYGPNLDGGENDDSLVGGALNNSFSGGPGNDTLDTGLGDDRLEGGAGDDTLIGGKGNDAYVLYLADLGDHDLARDKQGSDTLVFADFGITEITGATQGDDHELIIAFASGGSLTIEDHFRGAEFAVEQITAEGQTHPIRKAPTYVAGDRHDLLDIRQDQIYYGLLPPWAGYEVDGNGNANTDDWMGWINVTLDPYIYSWSLGTWFYMDESTVTESGAWGYVYK